MEIILQKPRSKKDFIGLAIVGVGKIATGDAKYCHVAIRINGRVYESLVFGGVSSRDFKLAYANLPHDVVEIPNTMMPRFNEAEAWKYLESLIGQFRGLYGLGKIPLGLLDGVASFIRRKRVFWFTKIFGIKSFPVCSPLVAKVLNKFSATQKNRDYFNNWIGMSPDDISDTLSLMKSEGAI